METNNVRVIDLTVQQLELLIGKKLKEILPSYLSQQPAHEKEKELLSIDEVSKLILMPKNSIYGKSARHEIPCIRRGRALVFEREKIMSWMREARKETVTDTESKINEAILGKKIKNKKLTNEKK